MGGLLKGADVKNQKLFTVDKSWVAFLQGFLHGIDPVIPSFSRLTLVSDFGFK